MNKQQTLNRDQTCDIRTFLGIEDKDLQKFLFMNHQVRETYNFKKIDNENKVGYYETSTVVRINQQGVFYPFNKLVRWVVYNKKTKKLSTNISVGTGLHGTILDFMFRDLFKYPIVMAFFTRYVTGTMMKLMLQGKIKSVRDLLNYHKSYTFKRKTLTPEVLFDAYFSGHEKLIHIFEDPENVNWDDPNLKNINADVWQYKIFKIKSSEVENVGARYNKWREEQSKKYAALPPGRNTGSWVELGQESGF